MTNTTDLFSNLIIWSTDNFSSFPWRKQRTLYRTWISEVMLQQTTLPAVEKKFESFFEHFPTISSLANASDEHIAIIWKGLGYYRRAYNLVRGAKMVVANFKGHLPKSFEDLLTLPGIGDYTACALQAIGQNKPYLAIDANIERVLARFFGWEMDKRRICLQLKADTTGVIKILLEKNSPRLLNEALMDLGREICRSKQAKCHLCPLKKGCASAGKDPLRIPIQPLKEKTSQLSLARLIVISDDHHSNSNSNANSKKLKTPHLLFYQKKSTEWLSGQWELPTFVLECSEENFSQYPMASDALKAFARSNLKTSFSQKSRITRYEITNIIFFLNIKQFNSLVKTKINQTAKAKTTANDEQDYQSVSLAINANISTTSLKIIDRWQADLRLQST